MQRRRAVIPINLRIILTLATFVGVIVAAAGGWAESGDTLIAGGLITALALFGSGFMLTDENGYARLGMFIAAGLVFYAMTALSAGAAII